MSRVIRPGDTRLDSGIFDVGEVISTPLRDSILVPGGANFTAVEKRRTAESIRVIRPDDFLVLGFDFVNLVVVTQTDFSGATSARLERANPDADAYIVVRFPPQHFLEEAFFQTAPGFKPTDAELKAGIKFPSGGETMTRPARARLSGESWLAFSVPKDAKINYTLAGLLEACKGLEMRLTAAAGGLGKMPHPLAVSGKPPATALELPCGLWISPDEAARWEHAAEPVAVPLPPEKGKGLVAELWHTRLVPRPPTTVPMLRAIWADSLTWKDAKLISPLPPHYDPSAPPPKPPDPFRTSLDARDRYEIVRLTTPFKDFPLVDVNNKPFTPQPVPAEQLMLSALGAWLKVEGRWEPPQGVLSVQGWRHYATMGRDHYVRVVYGGYLLPFGHRASLVKVTERKFVGDPSQGAPTAFLTQRMYVVVTQPTKVYRGPKGNSLFEHSYEKAGAEMPLASARITTLVTPDLAPPTGKQLISGKGQDAFWPRIIDAKGAPTDFLFHVVAVDRDGHEFDFSMPLVFVAQSLPPSEMSVACSQYNIATWMTEKTAGIGGRKVTFAEAKKPGETTLETDTLVFAAQFVQEAKRPTLPPGAPPFLPYVVQAGVRIPALKNLLGNLPGGASGEELGRVEIRHYPEGAGFNPAGNKGGVFASILNPAEVAFPAEKAGGMASPDMTITGLALDLGPVGGDLKTLADGTFNPSSFFDASAKLLGFIELRKVIGAADLGKVPKLTTQHDANSVTTTYSWSPKLQPADAFVITAEAAMTLTATLVKPLGPNGGEPRFEVRGTLKGSGLNFLNVIGIDFDLITFAAVKGEKLDFSVSGVEVKFLGPLAFINELQKVIPAAGFSDPPMLDVTAEGVTAGYTLGIPDIPVGAFSVTNISLSAGLTLPFVSKPARARFDFAERHNPFLVTYAALGGGGFLSISVGLDKVEVVEASIEFGGNLALDIGVATGAVYIMAGIHFVLQDGKVKLGGFVRAGGAFLVLGIVCISAEFYMELGFQPASSGSPSKVYGEATLTVEVEVAFFSKSVDLTVRREFEDPRPPRFGEIISRQDWDDYWAAFGEVA